MLMLGTFARIAGCLGLILIASVQATERVIVKDGDTLELGDTTFRLHGIDARSSTNFAWMKRTRSGSAVSQHAMRWSSGSASAPFAVTIRDRIPNTPSGGSACASSRAWK